MIATLRHSWDRLLNQPWLVPTLLAAGLGLVFAIPAFGLYNNYVQLVLMYVGINVILATSLNLVNGYMGEFSLAHAGFMAVGAYTSVLITMHVLPPGTHAAFFQPIPPNLDLAEADKQLGDFVKRVIPLLSAYVPE